MTLEEAEWIARNRLPDEPRADEITAWRASQPRPGPKRETRGLDTMPMPAEIDWADVIRRAILAERSVMSEVIGEAIGEVNNSTLDEVETLIAKTADQLREEINQMRVEFFKRLDLVRGQGVELRAEIEKIAAKKRRARSTAASPNGSGSTSCCLPHRWPMPVLRRVIPMVTTRDIAAESAAILRHARVIQIKRAALGLVPVLDGPRALLNHAKRPRVVFVFPARYRRLMHACRCLRAR
jgi:hypothetical protein